MSGVWKARTIFHIDCGFAIEQRVFSICERDDSFKISFRKPSPVERANSPRGDGIIAVADLCAETLDGTLWSAQREVEEFSAAIAVSSGAALGKVSPLLVYDITAGRSRRAFRHFFHCSGARRFFSANLDTVEAVLRKLACMPRRVRTRIQDALLHLTRSAAEMDQLEAFASAWLAVERLNAPLRGHFDLPKSREERHRCPEPECPGSVLTRKTEITGSKHLAVEVLKKKEEWKRIKEIRTGLQHGTQGLDELRKTCGGIAADVRLIGLRGVEILLELDVDTLAVSHHSLGERHYVDGVFKTQDLPPSDPAAEPYFEISKDDDNELDTTSLKMKMEYSPTFDFPYEVQAAAISGPAAGLSVKAT